MTLVRTCVLGFFALMLTGSGWRQKEHQHRHDPPRQEERDRDRWYWQLPEQVMNTIGVEKGMDVADIGAGYGYMTFRLARRVGPEGRVYANEIDERFTRELEARCKDEGVDNVTVILGTDTDPKLPGNTMDLVLMVNVIHLVDEPVDFLRRIQPTLKPGGKLIIVQWDAAKMNAEVDLSPSDKELYAKETVLNQITAADYEVERTETFLPMQNIFISKIRKGIPVLACRKLKP